MKNLGLLLALTTALGLGCSESVTPDDGGGGTDSGGSDSGGVDSGGIDAGGGDAGEPTVCGGFGGATCSAGEWCDYRNNICGAADGTGVCTVRPRGCPDVFSPVCGCDGTIHGNECEANGAGVDVNSLSGSCTPPTGQFSCGFQFCTTDTYCQVVIDDTGMPPAYNCMPFPTTCDGGGRDCVCVAAEPCGDMCMQDANGNVTVSCPGG